MTPRRTPGYWLRWAALHLLLTAGWAVLILLVYEAVFGP